MKERAMDFGLLPLLVHDNDWMFGRCISIGHPDVLTYESGIHWQEGTHASCANCMSSEYADRHMALMVKMWVRGVMAAGYNYTVWRMPPTIVGISTMDDTSIVVWRCAMFTSKDKFLDSDLYKYMIEVEAR